MKIGIFILCGILVAICKAIHLPIPTEPKQTANIPPAYHHNCSEKKANTPGDTSLQSISIKNSVASPPQKSTKPNFSSGGNCSEYNGVSVERYYDQDLWKTHVIMGCTITAAIEVFVIVVMLTYWKQLRWSLRKIECPCCNRRRRNRQERADNASEYEIESLTVDGDSYDPTTQDISSDSLVTSPNSEDISNNDLVISVAFDIIVHMPETVQLQLSQGTSVTDELLMLKETTGTINTFTNMEENDRIKPSSTANADIKSKEVLSTSVSLTSLPGFNNDEVINGTHMPDTSSDAINVGTQRPDNNSDEVSIDTQRPDISNDKGNVGTSLETVSCLNSDYNIDHCEVALSSSNKELENDQTSSV